MAEHGSQEHGSQDRARSVARVADALHTFEGEGFAVRRPFPTAALSMIDPFLLLDEMGPADLGPGEAKGAPDHPHRGFETVTYMLSGEFEHRDSVGNRGVLRPGDVQWMTAGAGVVHSEMPSAAFQETGGRLHGFQLWVNLPRAQKMRPPRYQDLRGADLGRLELPGGEVTVIAGEVSGVRGPAETTVPITFAHLRLDAGAEVVLPVGAEETASVYVVRGGAAIGRDRREVAEGRIALLTGDGPVALGAGPDGVEALLLAGRPLGEPVARYGPFVMNTRDELEVAVDDFRAGRLGRIDH